MASSIRPERGSERVKAWVYTILTPLIDALRRETALLKTGNLSWRAYKKRCEYIRPVNELINSAHEPILDDLLSEDSALRARLSEHDSALERLETAASTFAQQLMQASVFEELIAECLSNYATMRASNPLLPELGDASKIPAYVAEFLVNSTETLPQHYTMFTFWESFRLKFTQFKTSSSFHAISYCAESLARISDKLRLDLETMRLNMAREYDIPAAPIELPNEPGENSFRRFR
jgi:hypothetical protein